MAKRTICSIGLWDCHYHLPGRFFTTVSENPPARTSAMPAPNENTWYARSPDAVLEELDARREGLSSEEAQSRLEKNGPNTIRSDQEISIWKVLLDQFSSPLIYVLLGALVVTLVIQHWADATVIGAVLLINATIGFFQEYRAETAVQALMKMVSPKARVRRDGERVEIEGEQLVVGDLVILAEGEVVPADIRLLETRSLQVNESALTGESVPASKTAETMTESESEIPLGDQRNRAFMGTAVTSGHAEGVVTATGAQTELGKIAEDVREAGEIETPLQRRMHRLANWIAAVILLVAAVAFVGGLVMGRDMTEMFLLAVALAVSAIPEGLPVVVTVTLAIGVRRMARRHAVIRHLPAVETLGSTTVIVSDKTGTLTQNQMTVQEIFAGESHYRVSGEAFSLEGRIEHDGEPVDVGEDTPLYETLLVGLLNNSVELNVGSGGREVREDQQQERAGGTPDESNAEDAIAPRPGGEEGETGEAADEELPPKGDPMEVALLISAVKAGLSREKLNQQYPRIDEVPFQTEKRFSATIHDVPEGHEGPLVLIKGAPERLLEMCRRRKNDEGEEVELDGDAFDQHNEKLASQGLRVLAMAVGRGRDAVESIKGDDPRGMTMVGMQGLLDPPRPEAVQAVDDCHRAGIRVIMVTGDHAQTAAAIASQVHLDQPVADGGASATERDSRESPQGALEALTGQQLAELSDDELDQRLLRGNVFARVKPDHKMRIVNRLKAQQQIVAVTGDGVNDAPALKSAHLGVAMGQSGTDVAKEASDMVITDDNFASVYSAVEEGRTAFRNIRMATFFLLSTGAAEVVLILTALGLRWPLPLLPAQILWVNVVTNGIADVALAFEPGDEALARRPPRPISEGILDRNILERLVIVGIWLAICTLGVFYWVKSQSDVDLARVATLNALVLFQAIHVFNCRSEETSVFKKSLLSNKVLLLGVLISLAVHVAALYIPWTQKLLDLQPLPGWIWLLTSGVALTAILVNELHKRFRPRG